MSKTYTLAQLRKMKKEEVVQLVIEIQALTSNDRILSLERQLERAEEHIVDLEEDLSIAEQERREARDELGDLGDKIAELEDQVDELNGQSEFRSEGRITECRPEGTPTIVIELPSETYGSAALGFLPGQEVSVA